MTSIGRRCRGGNVRSRAILITRTLFGSADSENTDKIAVKTSRAGPQTYQVTVRYPRMKFRLPSWSPFFKKYATSKRQERRRVGEDTKVVIA